MDIVLDAVVYGEKNPIVGSIVCASISLTSKKQKDTISKIKKFCKSKLQNYKVPVKIKINNNS